jgi:hypothetical protein
MASSHEHRLLIISPDGAKLTAVVNWFWTNIGANSVAAPAQWPALNPSGLNTDPVTHRWSCGSFEDHECRRILAQLCQLASVTPPSLATWNSWTGAQKRSWLVSVRDTILANYGVLVWLANNTGVWDNPESALQAMNLKVRAAADAA